MTRMFLPSLWAIGIAVLVALMGCAAPRREKPADFRPGGPADYGPAKPFNLTDVATGKTFTLSSHPRRVVVLTFVAADCKEACPRTEGVLRAAAQVLWHRHQLGSQVEIVTIEIDPAFNSAAAVQSLRQRTWPRPGWRFLRDSSPRTKPVLAAYDVQVFARQPGKDVAHSNWVYVIDGRGRESEVLAIDVNLTRDSLLRAIARAAGTAGTAEGR